MGDSDETTSPGMGATWGVPDEFLTELDRRAGALAEQLDSILVCFPGTNSAADVGFRGGMRETAEHLAGLRLLLSMVRR